MCEMTIAVHEVHTHVRQSLTNRELGERTVGAVVETRVATHEGEGDSNDESQAGRDEVTHGGDLGGLGSHAPGLCGPSFGKSVCIQLD